MTGIHGGARTLADRMSTAARAWLAGLDEEQLAQGAWPWEPDGERLRWFARELVRSLDEAQTERALLTGTAPVDIVGDNRPRIGDGNLLMPLPDGSGRRSQDTAWRREPVRPATASTASTGTIRTAPSF